VIKEFSVFIAIGIFLAAGSLIARFVDGHHERYFVAVVFGATSLILHSWLLTPCRPPAHRYFMAWLKGKLRIDC
jgi:hypothetical protein